MKKINGKSEKQKEFAEKMRDKAIKERESAIEGKASVIEMLKKSGSYEGGTIQGQVQHKEAEIEWLRNCSDTQALIEIGNGSSQVAHFSDEIDFYEN